MVTHQAALNQESAKSALLDFFLTWASFYLDFPNKELEASEYLESMSGLIS